MKQFLKKSTAIMTAVALLFGFASCGKGTPQSGAELIYKKQNYVRQNNLSFENVFEDKDNHSQSYLIISGLADKEIEGAINKDLKACYDDLSNLSKIPPYRGTALLAKEYENADEAYDYCYESACCNIGNILSVLVRGGKSLYLPPNEGMEWGEYLEYGEAIGLNYDLTSGKQLMLTDLFSDPQKGLEAVNDYIYQLIEEESLSDEENYYNWEYDFNIIGFDGIKEDQKFYLSTYGESLYLILDYSTPWYVNRTQNCTFALLEVPLNGIANVDEVIQSETSVFTDERPNYALLSVNVDAADRHMDSVSEENFRGIPNLNYYSSVSYAESMPQSVKDQVLGYAEKYLDSDLSRVTNMGEDFANLSIYMEYNAYAYITGGYSNVEGTSYQSVVYTADGSWDSLLEDYDDHYECMIIDNETGKVQSLEDLFTPGYDVEGLLQKYDVPEGAEFYLGNTQLCFRTAKPDWFFLSIPYVDIGCENMTIFK